MKEELKEEWCARLESGKIPQAQGRLRHGDRRCCLGVLCDMAAEAGIGYWEEDGDDPGYFVFVTDQGGETGVLPIAVQKWAGIEGAIPAVLVSEPTDEYNDGWCGVAGLNDEGMTFPEISPLIRESL